ncbi:MAG TPA: RNA polymerase sigma factor [Actinomycetota bacterium]|nr:RNA polymerase sigma factor [Actinomycetota bacterium]
MDKEHAPETASSDDQVLVERFRRGDRAAFSTLVERHQTRVYNLAYRMLGRPEDAADATQEAFLACHEKLSGFRGDAAFTTWLHRVALNVCYDALRKRSRERPDEEEIEPPPVADASEATATGVDVHRALQRVPEEFRAVVLLHDAYGLPYEEIAEIIGVPVGTVKSRLHRGRVAMARILRGEPQAASDPSKLQERS